MFSLCQTTILLILLTVGVTNSRHANTEPCITSCNGQLKRETNSQENKELMPHLSCPKLRYDTNAACIDISNCKSIRTDNENYVCDKNCPVSVNWKHCTCSICCLESTVKPSERSSTLQIPDPEIIPNIGSTPYPASSGDISSTPSPNCRTEVTVFAVVLVVVIIASAVVISLLLWRMRKLAETYRCCERGCLSFCRIHNADHDSSRTSAPQLENPEQCYNTARRLDSYEHEYTALQERAGTSQTLPTPLERVYSLARNIPEEVTNSENEYSLASFLPAESEYQSVHNLVKHPNTISGGATPTYFILEKESDCTPACKESESNQE